MDKLYEKEVRSLITKEKLPKGRYQLHAKDEYIEGLDLSFPELSFNEVDEIVEYFNSNALRVDTYEILDTQSLIIIWFGYKDVEHLIKDDSVKFFRECLRLLGEV